MSIRAPLILGWWVERNAQTFQTRQSWLNRPIPSESQFVFNAGRTLGQRYSRFVMSQIKAYDKAKWHDETVENYGLPESHASHHIVFFFRWLIENNLISEWLCTEFPDDIAAVRTGRLSALEYFDNLDRCLVSDMLSDEGNAFADAYFVYDRGCYLTDLIGTLQGSLESEFHIPFTDETYARLKPIMDRRYSDWKSGDVASVAIAEAPKRRWWQFWK